MPIVLAPLIMAAAGVVLLARARERQVAASQVNWMAWLGYQMIAIPLGAAWVLASYLLLGVCLGAGGGCEPGTKPVLWQSLVIFVPWAIIWLAPSLVAGIRAVSAWREGSANPVTKRVGVFSGVVVLLASIFIAVSAVSA